MRAHHSPHNGARAPSGGTNVHGRLRPSRWLPPPTRLSHSWRSKRSSAADRPRPGKRHAAAPARSRRHQRAERVDSCGGVQWSGWQTRGALAGRSQSNRPSQEAAQAAESSRSAGWWCRNGSGEIPSSQHLVTWSLPAAHRVGAIEQQLSASSNTGRRCCRGLGEGRGDRLLGAPTYMSSRSEARFCTSGRPIRVASWRTKHFCPTRRSGKQQHTRGAPGRTRRPVRASSRSRIDEREVEFFHAGSGTSSRPR